MAFPGNGVGDGAPGARAASFGIALAIPVEAVMVSGIFVSVCCATEVNISFWKLAERFAEPSPELSGAVRAGPGNVIGDAFVVQSFDPVTST